MSFLYFLKFKSNTNRINTIGGPHSKLRVWNPCSKQRCVLLEGKCSLACQWQHWKASYSDETEVKKICPSEIVRSKNKTRADFTTIFFWKGENIFFLSRPPLKQVVKTFFLNLSFFAQKGNFFANLLPYKKVVRITEHLTVFFVKWCHSHLKFNQIMTLHI